MAISTGGKIIAFSGAHGTGKTTRAARRFVNEKINNPCLSIAMLWEVARNCPWPLNQNTTPQGQMWIFGTQLALELEMSAKNDVVVADRCLADNIAYARVAGTGFQALADRLEDIFVFHCRCGIYKEITFLPCAENRHLHPDGVRDLDPAWRVSVDSALRDILSNARDRCHELVVSGI